MLNNFTVLYEGPAECHLTVIAHLIIALNYSEFIGFNKLYNTSSDLNVVWMKVLFVCINKPRIQYEKLFYSQLNFEIIKAP